MESGSFQLDGFRNSWLGFIETVEFALGDGPGRVLIDARHGGGGFLSQVDQLIRPLLAPGDISRVEQWPNLHRPMSEDLQAAMRTCHQSASDVPLCGGYSEMLNDVPVGDASNARVAVLNSWSVSSSDFFSKLLSLRSAPTASFSPVGGWGAYGFILNRSRAPFEREPATYQGVDAIFVAGAGDNPRVFESGAGPAPQPSSCPASERSPFWA